MFDPISMAVTAGLGAYSAYSASKGQKKANEQGMAFNAQEAQKQRDWEERMFGSRYQMTRKDLEAANYNPMLALGVNPGVPSGASAHADPKSTKSESSDILSKTAKNVTDVALNRAMLSKVNADASSAQSLARIHEQDARIQTEGMGPKLAAYENFMRKTGIGKFAAGATSAFAASRIFKAVGKFAVRSRGFRGFPGIVKVRNPYDFGGMSA